MLFLIWGLVFNVFDNRRIALNSILQGSKSIQSLQLSNNQNLQLFLLKGFKDSSLYQKGSQQYLDLYHKNMAALLHDMKQLQIKAIEFDIPVQNLQELEIAIHSLSDSAAVLSRLVRRRGFKDFGLEGKMREAIHQIEDEALLKPMEYLTLRRHEKDFINRQEWYYVEAFNSYYQKLRRE